MGLGFSTWNSSRGRFKSNRGRLARRSSEYVAASYTQFSNSWKHFIFPLIVEDHNPHEEPKKSHTYDAKNVKETNTVFGVSRIKFKRW